MCPGVWECLWVCACVRVCIVKMHGSECVVRVHVHVHMCAQVCLLVHYVYLWICMCVAVVTGCLSLGHCLLHKGEQLYEI